MARQPRDMGASVCARLLTLAREKGQAFDLLLTRYTTERLLYRLSTTPHRDRFVLKGAMLLTTWFDDPHRPTRDVDFLGHGDPAPEPMLAVFREICAIEENDGVIFDVDALRVELIREELEYGGLRLHTTARLAGARIAVVIDIGFGDAIEPGVEEVNLPVLLDLPAARLRAYARETVVAEKFQAMILFGLANTRMKDFYDIWMLSRNYDFDGERLSRAIAATFERRGTAIPEEVPDALSPAFAADATKQRQWAAFVRDLATDAPSLETIVNDLASFLMPYAQQGRSSRVNWSFDNERKPVGCSAASLISSSESHSRSNRFAVTGGFLTSNRLIRSSGFAPICAYAPTPRLFSKKLASGRIRSARAWSIAISKMRNARKGLHDGPKQYPFALENDWYRGQTKIVSFEAEELFGTKLRALLQRRASRDLFDLHEGLKQLTLAAEKVIACFDHYLALEGMPITRAIAEQRMLEKLTRILTEDITPLLPMGIQFGELDAIHAFERVWIELIARMGGEGWKLAEPALEELRVKRFPGLLTSRDQLRRA